MGEREAKDDTSTQTEQAGTVTKELKNRCPKNILWVSLFFARFIIYEGVEASIGALSQAGGRQSQSDASNGGTLALRGIHRSSAQRIRRKNLNNR